MPNSWPTRSAWRGLWAARFEKGDRVAVWAPNIPEWVLLEYGAGLAGVVLVTVNPAYQPKELEYVLRQSRSSGIFYLRSFRGNPMEPDFASRDLSSVHTVCSGGATVPADLVRRIESTLGVQFSIIYGQTEASPGVTLMKPDDSEEDKANTLGPVLPQTEMKVIDPETGATVPIGEPGELCCRRYLVMLGYFEMPDKTAETIDQDGWLHTGDLVTMDDRGYTTITGRLRDMIIRGGENIYPREIEELLFEHPRVADVAVVGLPDERWGEIVGAFIRDADPANPVSDAELHAYCRENLSPQKTPKAWYRVDDFPLTPSGKIQKFVLLEEWRKGAYNAA